MDFSDFKNILSQTESIYETLIMVIMGVAALLLILVLVWLMIKLSEIISRKKQGEKKPEKTDEEEIFGD